MSFTTSDTAILQNVLRYEFHGILYFELRYVLDADAKREVRLERVASHIVYENPLPGDRIVLERLMGHIHKVARA